MSPAKAFRVTKPLPKRLPPGCWSGGSRRQKINFASQNRQPREHSVPPSHGVSKLGWHAKADSQQTKMNAPTPPRPLLTPWLHSGSSHKAQDPLRPPPSQTSLGTGREGEHHMPAGHHAKDIPAVSLLVETMSCWGRDRATSPSPPLHHCAVSREAARAQR